MMVNIPGTNAAKAVVSNLVVKPVKGIYGFADRRVEAAGDSLVEGTAHNLGSVAYDVLGDQDKGLVGYLKGIEQIGKGTLWSIVNTFRLRFGKVFQEDLAQVAGGAVNIVQNTVTTPIAIAGHTAKAVGGVLGVVPATIAGKTGSGTLAANTNEAIHKPEWGKLAA